MTDSEPAVPIGFERQFDPGKAMEWGRAMGELSAAIDYLATEDVSEIPRVQLAEQLLELHWQMARLQAQIGRRTGVRLP
ncbi:hypothetical protein FAF44_34300 [Nonomuraea sp. MG754425]|uniref:hypothetical protein n=1 Tax=Nonomuraea sp. MG754425 TaxID=2570319 RepID=UPI001F32F2A3|nr:hypothetical protein [Nonomuraea sp. MG754425]MCF6473420.1 hypothetical protein [Nonomuraea sp. MG754425]